MDQATPAPTPEPTSDPTPAPPPRAPDPVSRTQRRLQSRLETNEPLLAWTRGWVSREMRLHGVFAARTLDFGVVTEHWLFLLNTGFFTRRPRRCVYAARLEDIFVSHEATARTRRLRIRTPRARTLWFELRGDDRSDGFLAAVLARARLEPA